jgi:hypothetical protein
LGHHQKPGFIVRAQFHLTVVRCKATLASRDVYIASLGIPVFGCPRPHLLGKLNESGSQTDIRRPSILGDMKN